MHDIEVTRCNNASQSAHIDDKHSHTSHRFRGPNINNYLFEKFNCIHYYIAYEQLRNIIKDHTIRDVFGYCVHYFKIDDQEFTFSCTDDHSCCVYTDHHNHFCKCEYTKAVKLIRHFPEYEKKQLAKYLDADGFRKRKIKDIVFSYSRDKCGCLRLSVSGKTTSCETCKQFKKKYNYIDKPVRNAFLDTKIIHNKYLKHYVVKEVKIEKMTPKTTPEVINLVQKVKRREDKRQIPKRHTLNTPLAFDKLDNQYYSDICETLYLFGHDTMDVEKVVVLDHEVINDFKLPYLLNHLADRYKLNNSWKSIKETIHRKKRERFMREYNSHRTEIKIQDTSDHKNIPEENVSAKIDKIGDVLIKDNFRLKFKYTDKIKYRVERKSVS
jgi:hypothetical protein